MEKAVYINLLAYYSIFNFLLQLFVEHNRPFSLIFFNISYISMLMSETEKSSSLIKFLNFLK